MPDIDPEPVVLPENPETLAELLQYLPLPYEYAKKYACVFSKELADRLIEVQEQNPKKFRVSPIALTDGTYMIRGAILSEVPNGLYGGNFARLDANRFNEISITPWDDALALMPQPEEDILP
jgi:hypothetical protein